MTNGLIKPSEQFQQEIQPALDDYLKTPLSERLAKNLARVLARRVADGDVLAISIPRTEAAR